MNLKNVLYLVQLEEYNIERIQLWIKNNPNREVREIKKKLVWTNKIKALYAISKGLFFLPPEMAVITGLRILEPVDNWAKKRLVMRAKNKLRDDHKNMQVIGITGSYGKTTTKNILDRLLKNKFKSETTEGNKNTLLGICQKIMSLPADTELFVCEIGAYGVGDIKAVCDVIKPTTGIVTAFGLMHLERFGNEENIIKAKMELPQAIPENGTIYLPEDRKKKTAEYKINCQNQVYFKDITDLYQKLGKQFGIDRKVINDVLENTEPGEHRLQIINNGSIRIIDDTYNSNPVGFEMALNKIKKMKSSNRILVTPGMIELGSKQEAENTRLAKIAGNICQHVVIVGNTNRRSWETGMKETRAKIYFANNVAETQQILPTITTSDSVVLFENDLPDNYF